MRSVFGDDKLQVMILANRLRVKEGEYDLVEFVAEIDWVNVVTFKVGKHYNLDALSEACRLNSPWR